MNNGKQPRNDTEVRASGPRTLKQVFSSLDYTGQKAKGKLNVSSIKTNG